MTTPTPSWSALGNTAYNGAIPQWMIGRHLVSCIITPLVVTAAGTWSASTTVESLIGTLDAIEGPSPEFTDEMIQAIDNFYENYVPTGQSYNITLTEIQKSDSVFPNILPQVYQLTQSGTFYFGVAYKIGFDIWSMVGVFSGYRPAIGRGKTPAQLVLKMVDPGLYSSNVSYVNPFYASDVGVIWDDEPLDGQPISFPS